MATESEEIIAQNILIANFMNWVHHEDAIYDRHEMKNLKYHESWDALMPVVEKIESLAGDIGHFNVDISECCCRIYQYGYKPKFKTTDGRFTKIEAVYNVIVQFILWYNNQTTK